MRWVLVAAVVVGCTKPNPNRCCVDEADCVAKNIPVGSVCDPGLLCRGNQCIAEPCSDNGQCDPAAPFCIDSGCAEACDGDEQCPGFGQTGLQRCVDGTCVQCRDGLDCVAMSPVCESGACRGCKTNVECSSELSDIDAGTCIEEASIAYASVSGGALASCTRQDPCSLAHALALVDESRPIIKVAAGVYTGTVNITRSANVTLYGEPDALVQSAELSGASSYKVRDLSFGSLTCQSQTTTAPQAQLDAARLHIVDGFVDLIRCKAEIIDSQIKGTAGSCAVTVHGSSDSDGSELTMTRTEVRGGYCGVSLEDTSKLSVSNTVFRDQGALGAIAILESTILPSSVSFSTFYNTFWNCSDGAVLFASTNKLFLNEAGSAPANTVTGTRCVHNYDMIKPQANAPAGANNVLGADPKFVSASTGDFHLMANSPAIDAADPAATEPLDFDGTTRPQGSARDVGAFEYKP